MRHNYNYTRRKLYLPEYGRHIHEMVDSLLLIEDRAERTRQAKAVIAVMGNLNPLLRDTADFTHKLWDHLFIMSDFQLDVDSPYPQPVYKATNTSGQMSFEERMGCGFGACMGCSCQTLTGYKRICKDGPVMWKEEIKWDV